MITRLQIDGFKNLVGVDIRFGPFTCIAGANAVGKSNLFDAIRFLSDLTSKTLVDAAKLVRSEGQSDSDIRDLFHRVGNTYANRMSFLVDMIIPKEGADDIGQVASAAITTVRYELELAYRQGDDLLHQGILEIMREELIPINTREAYKSIDYSTYSASLSPQDRDKIKAWQDSVIRGRRTAKLISTDGEGLERKISIHQDGSVGRVTKQKASQLPKTMLSITSASVAPTALVVKNEMQSWKMLQFEPSALRKSDGIHAVGGAKLGADGSHLPATLYRIHLENEKSGNIPDTYQALTNRLSELVSGVKYVSVDRDEKRGLLTLFLENRKGTSLPARTLSDGTLRFLALSIIELDSSMNEVICIEEPENGIYPEKIDALLRLLQDIATDVTWPVAEDNPLRQIIINTHSPTVVQQVPESSLLIADLREGIDERHLIFEKAVFEPLADTWRTKLQPDIGTVSLGKLLGYLNPVRTADIDNESVVRVVDREDVSEHSGLFVSQT